GVQDAQVVRRIGRWSWAARRRAVGSTRRNDRDRNPDREAADHHIDGVVYAVSGVQGAHARGGPSRVVDRLRELQDRKRLVGHPGAADVDLKEVALAVEHEVPGETDASSGNYFTRIGIREG